MELIPLQLGSVRQQDLFTRVHTDGAYFTLTEAWTGRHLAVLGPAVDLPEADTVGISELHGDRWASLVHRVHETGREVIIARNRRPIAALRPPADREAAEPRDPELWAHAERACAAEMAKRSRLVAGMADPAAVAELATEIAYDLWGRVRPVWHQPKHRGHDRMRRAARSCERRRVDSPVNGTPGDHSAVGIAVRRGHAIRGRNSRTVTGMPATRSPSMCNRIALVHVQLLGMFWMAVMGPLALVAWFVKGEAAPWDAKAVAALTLVWVLLTGLGWVARQIQSTAAER
ncbi:type II toxin-antitoxin system Phd/YefM family antitoxin [Glycomyces sp. YM15]|uniref:type II toxin-antitoxin system Phd/YefM family antitoxin n=1 Tax=Glycomyces sp. YM15 TaxID=2800446 RepID=UPI001962839C|nr:hypothetical protein [Glycomyces sp. YM15]